MLSKKATRIAIILLAQLVANANKENQNDYGNLLRCFALSNDWLWLHVF